MIKKIARTLKNIFSGKKTPVVSKFENAKETKSTAHTSKKQSSQFKKGGNKQRKNYRKKETPEEYKARRAKLAEERRNDGKAENKSNKPQSISEKINEPVEKPEIDLWNVSSFKVKQTEGKTRFHDFNLSNEIMHAINDLGFEYCTEVQAETLPKSLSGDDITAQAQTGTGKTAAFLITIFNHIQKYPIKKKRKHGTPRSLILAPTRELVLQIEKDARELGKYVPCTILALLGGIDYKKQQHLLKQNEIDVLICTPGRLIDFMNKKFVDLQKIEILVIDEADRMLDMGFIPDVKKIVLSTPQKSKRQTMFFSATLTGDVGRLAQSWTRQALEVTIEPDDIAQKNIEQITYITTVDEKTTLLYNIINQKKLEKVLVFANRRDEAKKLKDFLEALGIKCALLTGQVEQTQRIKRLESFREDKVRVLVATDVASRGIHVEGISHVINFNMPEDPEDYVHRIGRTGRAGASGISINFADEQDGHALGALEEYLGKKNKCIFPEDELLKPIPESLMKLVFAADKKRSSEKRKSYKSGNKRSRSPRSKNKN
ncbi:MAG: DEAD/DEAH box helicase [Chlorobi bacterium]|nr:DEAD/DEAH box helicase [Chlorobiota bacterium]